MITLSNGDAEKVSKYLNDHERILSSGIAHHSSTKEINNLRPLKLLSKKIANKIKAIKPK